LFFRMGTIDGDDTAFVMASISAPITVTIAATITRSIRFN